MICSSNSVLVNLETLCEQGEFIGNELQQVKTNKIYKRLNMNLKLKKVFSDFNYNELTEIRKLHVLYAHQKKHKMKAHNATTETNILSSSTVNVQSTPNNNYEENGDLKATNKVQIKSHIK